MCLPVHSCHFPVACGVRPLALVPFMASAQGQYIYERGCKNGKRVQSNMGAKNHAIVHPSANKEHTLNQVSRTLLVEWCVFL